MIYQYPSSDRRKNLQVKFDKLAGLLILLVLLVIMVGCTAQAASPEITYVDPRPVILDVDMAHEDMSAALFLLQHPNVEVKAITVSGTGEAHCEPGVTNALGLLSLSDSGDLPVACGRETPLEGDHAFPAEWRANADNLYGLQLPEGGEPSPMSATELIAEILDGSSDKVSIVALGPLTNIAEALHSYPEIASSIEVIYVMGGAIDVSGNVGNSGAGIENPYAEWNIYVDPTAAQIVFESGLPVILIPLDATQDVPVTRKFFNSFGKRVDTDPAKFVHDLLGANLGFVDSGGFQFWDSLTAAIFTDESLADYETINLQVVTREGPESGYTKPTEDGSPIRVAVSADRSRFEELFLTILNWENP